MYTLINAGPSPYGRKVSVAMHEKGIAFETVFDLPWSTAVETRKHSPLEQLPILLIPDSAPLYDSCFIMDWLEWNHPEITLLPADIKERGEARQLQVLGERLMEIAQAIIFESHRPTPAEAVMERQCRKIPGGLHAAELMIAHQARGADCIPHMGEIALATTLLCWEFIVGEKLSPDLDIFKWRGRYPHITKRIEQLSARPSFQRTQPLPMHVDIAGETR